ncbi:conserved Plasmodium protein, unknown function [Plasmodium vivax]|uniref:(malaria parasite P. vivax) hypothetical protein n=1 Tax=Plasmodium vivax TaxID=5855 RepID=A0A1G4H8B3_PLAVI|nr:unnamed protein product [Plasmodium vivax]SCO71150.1 conserved Plasmodium protein, unknown function [Plasmodium vivax]
MHEGDPFGEKYAERREGKWERVAPLLLSNTKERSKKGEEKNITQINLEKCEQASILLDNLSTFEEMGTIEEGRCYKATPVDHLPLFNWQMRKVKEKSPLRGEITEEDLISNLYRYVGVPGADKGVVSGGVPYARGVPRRGERVSYSPHEGDGQKGEDGEDGVDIVDSEDSQAGPSRRHLPRADSTAAQRREDILAAGAEAVNNHQAKKRTNGNKYVFNLRTARKELVKDKKGSCSSGERIITYVKKSDRDAMDYRTEKKMKEQTRMHEEEKEKMKNKFEEMIKDLTEKYQVQEEKKKKLISSIYSKYMNMRNEFTKMKSINENVKSVNEKYKEEVNRLTANPVERTLLDSYKSKLDDYIALANCKGNKIQQLEREVQSVRTSADLLSKKNATLVEEKKRLLKGSDNLKRDNVKLQTELERARRENQQLRDELFYKDMKVNYLVSILNVVDETILGDGGGGAAQRRTTTQRGATQRRTTAQKGTTAQGAIQKMNKKILIKSIVQKIKDINRKIQKEEETAGRLPINVGAVEGETCGEAITRNGNQEGVTKQSESRQMLEAYFDSDHFTLNESAREASTGENAHAAFFVNGANAGGKPFNELADQQAQVGHNPSAAVAVTGADGAEGSHGAV